MLARVLLKDNGSIALSIRSNAQKFSASHTANIAHTLSQTISECLKANSVSTIGELDICSRRDYEQVMSWNKSTPQAVEATFHQHFETVAQKTPDAAAICSWDRNLTYSELDTLSAKLANRLVELGVKPEMLVLMCFDKSAYAVVSMLGIFKAGGAFVAIDPSYPTSRIQAITEATKASVVIAEPAHCHLFEGVVENIVALDSLSAEKLPAGSKMARPDVSPSNIAYGVFTSGSTGTPKGIMIEHRALVTAAHSLAAPMRVSSTTRFLQFAAYTFDLCYGDIFVTLSQGGCICVPSEHERVNDLAGAIVRMDVNTACLIPSVARIFRPEDVPSLKNLLLGGEALLQESLDLWAGKVNLVQMYGPSEATIWCTSQDLQADSKPNNIGRGLAARLWITNTTNHDQLCPIGCIGELLIEGPVLARGYLDAQQTKDNFIEDPPWAQTEASQRRRFYKTGDLVKYNPNGTVSFIGRKDTQVKFHGRRIELGEIEHHLSSHESVRQSMIALPSAGMFAKHLVAIVVLKSTIPSKDGQGELKAVTGGAKETTDKQVAKVKEFLSSRVSSYMLPQYWLVVEDIPLMISGKMNRVLAKKFVESLMEEERVDETKATVNSGHTSPDLDDPIEARLRDIWSHILDKKATDIGVNQTFFSLGGDSFSAMELVASCKAEGLGLTVKDVLSSTTIREMASILRRGTEPRTTDFPQQHRLKFAPIWWDVPTTA
jgi:amino acid adenylation domain-containing protein